MFSPIDEEMNRFVKAIQTITFGEGKGDFLFSGYDIERWIMKCCLSMQYAKLFKTDFDFCYFNLPVFMDCLTNPVIGNKSGGLYMDAHIGEDIKLNKHSIAVAPITFKANVRLAGLQATICGLSFKLIMRRYVELEDGTKFDDAVFRPSRLRFAGRNRDMSIFLTWYSPHGAVVTMLR